MSILETIQSPADVQALPAEQLPELAHEIRQFLVDKVSATGGHLGPNLGVVELTIALHRVFSSPSDALIFDTSHQSYVHKILTGRAGQFDTLRQKGGLSGYTSRSESDHDWTESSHASAALSFADGLAKAFQLSGQTERNVVAVVGDGALTGGMCWEALNNIAADSSRKVIIVVNDNGRSYSPTIGGLANSLAALRTQPFYDKVMKQSKTTLNSMGWMGKRAYEVFDALKEGVKYHVIPTEMFPELGMKYVGPVDGYDLSALEHALRYAAEYNEGPIIVHTITEKGHGWAPAVNDVADQMHSTGIIDPITGKPLTPAKRGWTAVFADELIKAGGEREDVVAITAAMAGPTGLAKFAEHYPSRMFDVGIAEQHAVTSAAGLAAGGMHPVVAVYSTFLNRAFDQLLMDVGLLHLPVTIVLDRAGVTGSDGASHNGVWDMSMCAIVPGIRIAAPRDGIRLAEQFQTALTIEDGPTVVRFPKGTLPDPLEVAATTEEGIELLYAGAHTEGSRVLVIAVGAMAGACVAAARALSGEGIGVDVHDPEWVVPVPAHLPELIDSYDVAVVVEDGVIHGGIGSLICEVAREADVDTPIHLLAVPEKFLDHATRDEILAELGLDPTSIATTIAGLVTADVAIPAAAEDSPQ
ncbi:MAG: 1-deoxy-D-xylulose-5-phosphate synthase [Corynebacterium sp.]|nr:1-deoxy-D-xylulose-5-phosphate synthase [Corynebacterium sp.]